MTPAELNSTTDLGPISMLIADLGFDCYVETWSVDTRLTSCPVVRVIIDPERSVLVLWSDANTLRIVRTSFEKTGPLSGETKQVGQDQFVDLHDPNSPQQLSRLLI